jgi:hypothetical protein
MITAAALIAQDLPERGKGRPVKCSRADKFDWNRSRHRSLLSNRRSRANHFILVDEKGRERASLVADQAGSVFLVMFDANGKTRANLSVSNDGPSLVLYDPTGRQRTIVGSTTVVGSHVNDNGVAEKDRRHQ